MFHKRCSEHFCKINWKTPQHESLFHEIAGLQHAAALKWDCDERAFLWISPNIWKKAFRQLYFCLMLTGNFELVLVPPLSTSLASLFEENSEKQKTKYIPNSPSLSSIICNSHPCVFFMRWWLGNLCDLSEFLIRKSVYISPQNI